MSIQNKQMLERLDSIEKRQVDEKWRGDVPTWCSGCGHFAPLEGIYEAAYRLQIEPKNFVLVSGIGCSGRMPFFVKGYGLHALHGRALPVATGVKIANPNLTVIVVGGDGDGLGIGGGHFPHAARLNLNITYILMDNSIYGLTKGQVSPTSPQGMIASTAPFGNFAKPLNPIPLSIQYGATFVARTFSRHKVQVADTIREAIAHPGFSFVHVLSPCVEFNQDVTYKSIKQKIAPIPTNHTVNEKLKAIQLGDSADPIYEGLFFKQISATYDDFVLQIKKRKSI